MQNTRRAGFVLFTAGVPELTTLPIAKLALKKFLLNYHLIGSEAGKMIGSPKEVVGGDKTKNKTTFCI